MPLRVIELGVEAIVTVLSDVNVEISSRGDVDERDRALALDKLTGVAAMTTRPILVARLRLAMEPNPARERPAVVQGALDLDGQVARARVAAPTMREAIARFEERLRERVELVEGRPLSLRLRHFGGPDEWRRGGEPTTRPPWFDRPREEREVVARKEYALEAQTPDEAVFDMEILDHDFFLFTNATTGEDNVVARVPGRGYEIMQPTPTPDDLARAAAPIRPSEIVPPTVSTDDALRLLDLSGARFVFFLEPATGRGHVVYRRYDGHYGLITPAA